MDWLGVEWNDREATWYHDASKHWRTGTYRSQWFDETTCDLEWGGNWSRTFPTENGNPNYYQPSTSGPTKSPNYLIYSGKAKNSSSVANGAVYGTMLPQGWDTDYPAACGGRNWTWNFDTRRMGSIAAVTPERPDLPDAEEPWLGGIYARFVHWNRTVDWSYCWKAAIDAAATRKVSSAVNAAQYCFNPPASEHASLDMSTEPLRHQF